MIVACHQPNFIPYPGFFHKIKNSNVFALSDVVKMSHHAFFNYNYIRINGEKKKLTVPIHGSTKAALKDIRLCEWEHNKRKIASTISQAYRKSAYSDMYMPEILNALNQNYEFVVDLNTSLIRLFIDFAGIKTPVVFEHEIISETTEPNSDIVKICKALGGDSYLCGNGACGYFMPEIFEDNGIEVLYSDYVPDSGLFSSLHYLLEEGRIV